MDWQTLRNQFMRDIGGDPPGSHLEDELILAYTDHPDAVERSTEKITLAFKAGKIHSPWGALKTEVGKAVDAARNPTHSAGASREKAVARAEQWLRTAGLHYDRTSEIEHALFGNATVERTLDKTGKPILTSGSALLEAHQDDRKLRERLIDLWRSERPRGEKVEHEAEERGAKYVQQRDQLRAEVALVRKLADAGVGNLEPPVLDDDDGIPF